MTSLEEENGNMISRAANTIYDLLESIVWKQRAIQIQNHVQFVKLHENAT